MPLKKKAPAVKTVQRPAVKRTKTQETVTQKTRKDGKAPQASVEAVSSHSAAAVVKQPAHALDQLEVFEAAIRLFHTRKFREARERFLAAANGSDRGIAHKAQLHVSMCDRRLQEQALVLRTPDEHYDYAITLINERKLGPARQHLMKALEQQPEADHIYYALALCDGLSGDLQGAYENLKRAIEIQPRNRISARQDADFAHISNQPPLDRLLFPERVRGPY
jgi:tetratricopeptide (TPR) repeat protein